MDRLSILDDKCRQCYRCVRVCPTNALKIDQGAVRRIWNRCVLCGACYKHCPHDAVQAHTGVNEVLKLLKSDKKVIVCLDPTFPAVMDKGTPYQLVTALKKSGFDEVWESAVGGELVTRMYSEFLARNSDSHWICSFCPSLVLYIERFVPQMTDQLVPVVSPMVACGMAVKHLRGDDKKVVFVGSCISRIWERMSRHAQKYIDYVLTYFDIIQILEERGINREEQDPSEFDGPNAGLARILGIAGGMTKCIGLDQDLLNLDYVIGAGAEDSMRAIKQLQDGTIHSKFLDLLFCKGCINGPIIDKKISGPSRKQIVVNFVKSQKDSKVTFEKGDFKNLAALDLMRSFSPKDVSLPKPEESEINEVLSKLGKTYPDRNLDCGACGYNSCRDKAIAVVQGLAEMEMCSHYLLERLQGLYSSLEKSHKQLKNSHEELEQAQRQLIQTEKMASLGQLAAGVAHELNNPMGTITMFGRILQEEMGDNEKWKKDMNLIVKEADRAAKIVKDLLNFSRETKIKPGLVNINDVIEEALSLLEKQSMFHNIEIIKKLDSSIPPTFADPDLLKQVFLNIILNGAQAMEGNGKLTLMSQRADSNKKIKIIIKDTGKGIPEKNLQRLFDPFFTTKEKGTGLGLALVYSIVSKHKGLVNVESKQGKGASFFIEMPVLDQKEWAKNKNLVSNNSHFQRGDENETKRKNLIG